MRFRIKYADRIVGAFVILAALVLVGGIVLLGANQRWFAKDFRFKAVFGSGAGLSPGTAILMKGFQVGKIDKLRLTDDNQVEIDFAIYDTYYEKARENSVLEVVTSPIGLGTQLLFHPGKSEILMPEGTRVPSATSPEGIDLIEQELVEIPVKDDTITRLISSLGPLLENANKIIVTMNRTLTEVNRAIAGQSAGPLGSIVNEASSAMTGVKGLVGDARGVVGTTGDQVEALMKRADDLTQSLGRITSNLETTTEALKDPTGLIPKLLDPKGSLKTLLDDKNEIYDRLSASLVEVEKTIKSLSSMTSSLEEQVPTIVSTLEETKTAIKKGQDVLTGLTNNPLLKGGIPERKEQSSIYQSLREGEF